MPDQQPVEQLDFEHAYQELETIINQLEEDERSLEEMLNLFERGQKLARRCESLLEQAELRVQEIAGQELRSFDES